MKIFKVLERNQKNAHDDINENFDKLYPIGDIILNVRKDYDPNIELGGVWERFGKGRTIVSVDESDADFAESNKTGGAKTHKHSMEKAYSQLQITGSTLSHRSVQVAKYNGDVKASNFTAVGTTIELSSGTKIGGTSDDAGNLPPYIALYMWVRTA